MANDIEKILVELKEYFGYQVADTATREIRALNEAGIKYETDFTLTVVKGEKFRFNFADRDSFNLAIRILRVE